MATDAQLFCGIPVRDLAAGIDWYAAFLGRPVDEIVGDEAMWHVSANAWLFTTPDAQHRP